MSNFVAFLGTSQNQKLSARRNRWQLPNRINFQQVMAAPPSTTLTTSHTIASPFAWPSVSAVGAGTNNALANSFFSVSKSAGPAILGTITPNYVYVDYHSVNYGGGSIQKNAVQQSFMHDGTALEIAVKGVAGAIMTKINDQYISLSPQSVPNDGGVYFYYLPFGSLAKRRIDVLLSSAVPWGGVYTAQTDSIEPAPVRGPRVIIMGDSFTEGSLATGAATTNFVQAFADAMGWDDVWPSGVGSTGFLATSAPRGTYRSRLATDVIPYAPEILIVHGSINDSSFSGAAIGAEAALFIAQVQASLPNCLICFTGPFVAGGKATITANVIAQRLALKAAIQSAGGIFLDILCMPTPFGFTPNTLTLAAGASGGATSLSVTPTPAVGTYEFADGTGFFAKALAGTGPFTITTESGIQSAESNGAALTQVGDCFWKGSGHVGATSGFGNCDLYVASDTAHLTQAGHTALGQALAMLFLQALAPN